MYIFNELQSILKFINPVLYHIRLTLMFRNLYKHLTSIIAGAWIATVDHGQIVGIPPIEAPKLKKHPC